MAERWFAFLEREVVGPYAAAELPRLDGFGPATLVCAEDRKGHAPGNWRAAGDEEALAGLFPAEQGPERPAIVLRRRAEEEDGALRRLVAERLARLDEAVARLGHRVSELEEAGKSPILTREGAYEPATLGLEVAELRRRLEALEGGKG